MPKCDKITSPTTFCGSLGRWRSSPAGTLDVFSLCGGTKTLVADLLEVQREQGGRLISDVNRCSNGRQCSIGLVLRRIWGFDVEAAKGAGSTSGTARTGPSQSSGGNQRWSRQCDETRHQTWLAPCWQLSGSTDHQPAVWWRSDTFKFCMTALPDDAQHCVRPS